MSRIYQALEKAEKERAMESKKDLLPLPAPDQEEAREEEVLPESGRVAGMVSRQDLVSFFEPNSLASEQFRKLRSHLLKLKIPEPPKTIMVTSALDGEGKSFIAANLAAGLANDLQAHALLVDCDLRNPSLSSWFSHPEGRGLSDYLKGNGSSSELILKTEVEKLHFIPGGRVQDNPTELIGSRKMEALVRELKMKNDERYVIFDSTPLLATTEPELLAKWVDGIILVVRAGLAARETIQQALKSLEKEKILGVVLNSLDFRSWGLHRRYFGSNGYYCQYGYGKRAEKPENRWERLSQWIRRKVPEKD